MGRDSNPRCLSAHTLSRRAQSTTLSPIPKIAPPEADKNDNLLADCLQATIAGAGIVHRVEVECR